ncbi:WD40 repeat domain-containing protein [Embleya hyalina]|uniref:WD40 repeat domain-containing protein n=1 Tax=Embleya hyalina TaxID=516124 RepID=UPI001356EF0A|nr:WD40 repeat domain-containing protein [Embleya hyalina]
MSFVAAGLAVIVCGCSGGGGGSAARTPSDRAPASADQAPGGTGTDGRDPGLASTPALPSIGRLVRTFTDESGARLDGPLAFSPDGGHLAGPGQSADAFVWDNASGAATKLTDPIFPGRPVSSLSYTRDGRELVTTGYQDRAWDPATGALIANGFPSLTAAQNVGGNPDRGLGFGRDGTTFYVYTGVSAPTVAVGTYTLSGTALAPGASHHLASALDTAAYPPVVSPDGLSVIGAAATAPAHAPWLIDLASGTATPVALRPTDASPGADTTAVGYSPDGKLLAVARLQSDGEAVTLYDTTTWTRTVSFRGNAFAFSPDGKTLAVGSNDTGPGVQLYTVADGKGIGTLSTTSELAHSPGALAFGPDGGELAAAEGTAGIELWNVRP